MEREDKLMAKLTLGERVNDIRKKKRVATTEIIDAGISKTKYYSFIRGEIDLTMADLLVILDVLGISFSDLFSDGYDEGLVVLDTDVLEHDVTELLWAKQEGLFNTYKYEFFTSRQTAVKVIDFIVKQRRAEDVSSLAADLYQELQKVTYFSLFELRVAALIGPYLTPLRYFNLYMKFVEASANYQDYLPATLYDISLTLHVVALRKFIIEPGLPNRAYVEFIFEAIENQPTRPSSVELHILRRFIERLSNVLISDSEVSRKEISLFLESARRMGAEEFGINELTISFEKMTKKVMHRGEEILSCAMPKRRVPLYSELDFRPRPADFGELIHQTIRSKKISRDVLAELGYSNKKLMAMYKNPGSLRTSEMFDIMRLTALEPTDIDGLLMTRTKPLQVSRRDALTLGRLADQAQANWQKTQSTPDLESYLNARWQAEMAKSANWFKQEEALKLSQQTADLLLSLETWNETEARLAKIAFLSIDTPEGINLWVRQLQRGQFNGRVYTNTVVDAVEYLIFRQLFVGNQELIERAVRVAEQARENDSRTKRYLAWRWRLRLYDMYRHFLDEPMETIQELSTFFVDYEELLGDLQPVRHYQALFIALWRQYR